MEGRQTEPGASSGHGSDAAAAATTDPLVAEMNERIASMTRAQAIDGVVPRFNQAKTLACLEAEFRVHDSISTGLKHGLFTKPGTYRALLRFANASTTDDSKKDLRGLSIKVSGVDGEPLWGEPGIQDFLFNSYPALFAATPEDFLAFIKARQKGREWMYFLNPLNLHLKSLWILFKARKKHLSPFDLRYWSTTPYQLGADAVVKYCVTPSSSMRTRDAVEPGPNQLRAAMKAHLGQAPACFEFGVQKQLDVESMPIEDASAVWDEARSPFETVATITIEEQAFDTPESLNAHEKASFNPWQSLAAHRPMGRMNEVRRETYARAAQLRKTVAP